MMRESTASTDRIPPKAAEQQLNRACEACRLSKVRCLVNPGSTSSQCQRCAKAGRACVFAPPAKRRQRKRTDVRVAELEREIKQMRTFLKPNQPSPAEGSDPDSMVEDADEQTQPMETGSSGRGRSHESPTTPLSARRAYDWPPFRTKEEYAPTNPLAVEASEIDIIDRGIISEDTAEELLDIYRNELTQQCPGVVIARDWTAAQLREKKSALFHAVMAAASHFKGSGLSNKLHEEVVYLFARSLFIKGEKSVQYIQALLVTVNFYTPPSTPAQLQIYQYSNMAACMALELGLASKPRTHEQLPKRAIRSLQRISSPEELLENCRTVLILYVLTAGFAMRLRRPNILQYNSWMEECLCLMQKSPLLDDKRVVAWLKLQRIADQANTAFGFDDASTSISLSELRLQVILRGFERQMQDWRKSIPQEVLSPSLMIEHYQNMISMFEFAMDGGQYDAPDFRNRHLTLPALDDDCIQPESLLSRSALQINATIKCIGAAHSLLDCFESFSIEKLQKAPNVVFVRAIYALVGLMKADYAVGTDAEGMGEVLESHSLKVDYYLNMVLEKTSEAIGPQKCRVPSHWLYVLNHKLKTWYDEYQQWRREGKHLRRNGPSENKGATASTEASQSLETMRTQGPEQAEPASNTESSLPGQGSNQLPAFSIQNSYNPWPTTALDISAADTAHSLADPPAFSAELGDFSAAFQHGDLYLWNDVNESYGGWFAQGGNVYSDMQFGEMNGQGL